MNTYIHMLRSVDMKTVVWEGHTKYLSGKMDKNTQSITKEMKTNKRKTDLDAKKMSAAMESLNQEMQDMKADHQRQITTLTEEFKSKMRLQTQEYKRQMQLEKQNQEKLNQRLKEAKEQNAQFREEMEKQNGSVKEEMEKQ